MTKTLLKLLLDHLNYRYTSFKSDGIRESTPKIDIKSKHVKTSRAVLDDVHIILSPQDDHISIDKLSFNNLYLKMQSSGKWYTDKNEKTEILAILK